MANRIYQSVESGPALDLFPFFQSVADNASRKAMAAVLDEYEQLEKISADLAIPHMAAEARDKLKAAGITLPGSESDFRAIFLARSDADAMERYGLILHDQIVSRLEQKATPIVSRIKSAAIAEIEKMQPHFPREEAAIAERLGLPQEVIWSPLHKIIRNALDGLRADLGTPVVLRNGAPRRAVLSKYFAEPL